MKLSQPNSICINLNELHGVPESQHIAFERSIPLLLAHKHDTVNFGMTELDHSIYMVYDPKEEHVLGLSVNTSISFSSDRGTLGTTFHFVLPEACFYGPGSFRKALLAILWKFQKQIINHLADTLPEGMSNAEYTEVLSHNEDEAINEDNPLFHVPGITGSPIFSHSYAALSKLAESIVSVAGLFLMENDVYTGSILVNEHARLPTINTESHKIDLAF